MSLHSNNYPVMVAAAAAAFAGFVVYAEQQMLLAKHDPDVLCNGMFGCTTISIDLIAMILVLLALTAFVATFRQ